MEVPISSLNPTFKKEQAHGNSKNASTANFNGSIWCCCWTQSDLVTGSVDGTVKVWSLQSVGNEDTAETDEPAVINEMVEKFCSPAEMTGCSSLAAAKDGSVVIGCFQDSTIRLYDPRRAATIATIDPGLFQASAISLSPADDVLVAGTSAGGLSVWSMQEGHELLTTLNTQNKQIMSTTFSMDGKLASSSIDGLVNVFDMSNQKLIHTLDAHALPIRSVAFSPDGDLVYTASDDRHVNVYEIKSGTLINSFSHSGMALSVDSSPDKRHFAVGCADFTVSLWDLGMQKRVDRVATHTDHVWSVSYDQGYHSNARFASVGDDGTIQIYE